MKERLLKLRELNKVANEDLDKAPLELGEVKLEKSHPEDKVYSLSRQAASKYSAELLNMLDTLGYIMDPFEKNVLNPNRKGSSLYVGGELKSYDMRLVKMADSMKEAYENLWNAAMMANHLMDGTGD